MWTRSNLGRIAGTAAYAGPPGVPTAQTISTGPGGFPIDWPGAPITWVAPNPMNTGLMEPPPAPPNITAPFTAWGTSIEAYATPAQTVAATPTQAATQPTTTTVAPVTLVSPMPTIVQPPPAATNDQGGLCAVNGWVNSHPLLALGIVAGLFLLGGKR